MPLSKSLLQGVAEATCVGILTTDDQLQITSWNHWLETNSKMSAANVIGQSLLEVFPELRARRLDRYYHQALGGQMVVLSQVLHGYLLPFRTDIPGAGEANMQQTSRIAPVVEKGRVVGTVTVIEDVSERVIHETALRARAREQATLAELSQRALVGGDFATLAKESVQALAILLDVPHHQIHLLDCEGRSTVTGENQAPPFIRTLCDFTSKAIEPVVIDDVAAESRMAFPSNAPFVSAVSVPVFRGKKPYGILVLHKSVRQGFSDETVRVLQSVANMLGFAVEREHLEQQLRHRAESLAEEAQRKDEFLAMLAHELRNPLAPIRNAVQIIRMKGFASPSVQQANEIIDRQVQQMVRLVDDLLDVSRISRGKVQLRIEKTDLNSIVARAVESVRPLIDARKHELTLAMAMPTVWLNGDSARLVQILSNLLNNAAKYTDSGGRLWLTAERSGDDAVLRVRDSGIGIRSDLLPKIFDLFVQSDRDLDRSEGGLGIGLTLARRLVEMHGGSLSATSAGLGLGSEFVVRLPALVESERISETASGGETRKIPPAARRRVLVVDDNVDAAASLAMLLQLQMHEVHLAHDGQSALAEAEKFRPEVIFLDIGLPGMDGYEVARTLRRKIGHEDLVLVAMTGYGQEDDRRASQAAGFDGHLVKPADLAAVSGYLKHVNFE